ncbi:MAG: HAD family hydrolase [Candidatus Woesearchaeota archaeon]
MIYLFDWDGTLLDPSIYDAIRPKLQTYSKFSGDSGIHFNSINQLDVYYDVLKKEASSKDYLIKEMKDLLIKLKKEGNVVGIVTNSYRKTIELYLDVYQLKVDFIFACDDANATKQDEIFWQKLIKKHNLNPKQCLMMGDDYEMDHLIPKKFGFNTKLVKN